MARIVLLSAAAFADTSIEGAKHIVEKLEKISRNFAEAGRRKHWCYDTNRHIAVLAALQAERTTLARLENAEKAAA